MKHEAVLEKVKSKLVLTIFSTAQPIWKNDWPSSIIQKILTCLFYNKVI